MVKNRRIESYRRKIDHIDDAIVRLLLRRIRVVRELHKLKARYGLPLLDRRREAAIFARLQRKFPALGATAVKKIFRTVIWAGKNKRSAKGML